jgi:DNA-binding transcriptional LysR family regulator
MFSDSFPEIETPAVSVGLGTLGLDYMLQNGGSGYFPKRIVQSYIDRGRLFRVEDAPVAQRNFYVVYSASEKGSETLELALRGMREIVSREPAVRT